jgi:hypothetical protein
MVNVHRIETEAAHQRFEWQRAVAAEAQSRQAFTTSARPRWWLPRPSLAGLGRTFGLPRYPKQAQGCFPLQTRLERLSGGCDL